MKLTGVHLLLTYQCTCECDHCFVWGGPRQSETMTFASVVNILHQARRLGSVRWIYFEGGEPFLFHPLLVRGVDEAARLGFEVGIVSNAYWATDEDDAVAWLRPLAGKVQDLSLSCDAFHGGVGLRAKVDAARLAARYLGIPCDEIVIAPVTAGAESAGQIPAGQSGVMYRGRAAVALAAAAPQHPWEEFAACPHEDLREPGRVHVDPLGHVHLCQGITIGNVFETPLVEICEDFDPDAHPIAGPLLAGGPSELTRRHHVRHAPHYADACHLCYETRLALRKRFPHALGPSPMYGICG